MKKWIVLFFAMSVLSGAALAGDNTYLICSKTGQEPYTLAFNINSASHTVKFQLTKAFENAQITTKPLAYDTTAASNVLAFDYRWYYTAHYEFVFEKPIASFQVSELVKMSFSGDDDDNSRFESEPYVCLVAVKQN